MFLTNGKRTTVSNAKVFQNNVSELSETVDGASALDLLVRYIAVDLLTLAVEGVDVDMYDTTRRLLVSFGSVVGAHFC